MGIVGEKLETKPTELETLDHEPGRQDHCNRILCRAPFLIGCKFARVIIQTFSGNRIFIRICQNCWETYSVGEYLH